jgi:AbiV family abortive infection protein
LLTTLSPVPSQRASGPLTDEQLAALAGASLQSAVVLISDALDLHKLGSVPHAYATAILAGEEFGKCQLAVGAVGHIASAEEAAEDRYWRQFWTSFYGHGQKLIRTAWIAKAWIADELVDAFVALLDGALFSQRREAGLYVDVIDGVVVTPGKAISEAETGEALDVIGGVIAAYRSILVPASLSSCCSRDRMRSGCALPSKVGTSSTSSGCGSKPPASRLMIRWPSPSSVGGLPMTPWRPRRAVSNAEPPRAAVRWLRRSCLLAVLVAAVIGAVSSACE